MTGFRRAMINLANCKTGCETLIEKKSRREQQDFRPRITTGQPESVLELASIKMSYSLLAAVRFDPFLETFTWNNGPDGLPSPYLLLSHQFHRFVSASVAAQWPSAHLTFDELKSVCDNVVRDVNGTCVWQPLKVSSGISLSDGQTTGPCNRYVSSCHLPVTSLHPLRLFPRYDMTQLCHHCSLQMRFLQFHSNRSGEFILTPNQHRTRCP